MKRYLALQKIVQYGSFAKAAEEIGYTQSALSQAIASLEDELGMTLLTRSRTGSALTDEGKELYPYIERTIFQYRASVEKAKEINGLETGIVRMGTVASVSVNWLPGILKNFHKMYPGVEVVVYQGDYTMIEEWLKSGEIDFGFVSSEHVKGIEVFPLIEDTFSAVLPPGHPLTDFEEVPIELLAKEPFIMLEMGHHSECEGAFADCGIQPKVRYKFHDDYTIMAMVEQNMGVSLLADLVMKRAPFDIEKRPVSPPVKRIISIGYRNRLELPIAAKKFIYHIIEYVNSIKKTED